MANKELRKLYMRYATAKARYKKAVLENDPRAENWLALVEKHYAEYQRIKNGG